MKRTMIPMVIAFVALAASADMMVSPATALGQSTDSAESGLPMGRIFFTSDRGEDHLDIWVLEAGAAEPRQLTHGRNVDWRPVASPDGSHVLFMSDRDGDIARNSPSLRGYQLYIVDSDGTDERHFYGSQSFNASGGWSPDGTQVAIQSDISGRHQVHLVPVDIQRGQTPPLLTDDPDSAARPDWSPDGKRVVFDSSRHGPNPDGTGNREIYVIDIDGSNERRLTDDPGTDMDAEWSPDGSRIAFQSDRAGQFDIYVMDADGGGLVRLTEDPDYDASPTWSPDGTMIAFETKRDGDFEIYVMNADGTGQRNVTNNPAQGFDYPGQDSFPDWVD